MDSLAITERGPKIQVCHNHAGTREIQLHLRICLEIRSPSMLPNAMCLLGLFAGLLSIPKGPEAFATAQNPVWLCLEAGALLAFTPKKWEPPNKARRHTVGHNPFRTTVQNPWPLMIQLQLPTNGFNHAFEVVRNGFCPQYPDSPIHKNKGSPKNEPYAVSQ